MADIRILRGARSRTPGTTVGVQVSTFGLDSLENISGAELEAIALEALEPAREQVAGEWPILTGASLDSLRTETDEIGPTHVRVSLRIGGPPLMADARNEKHIDYAPFIEFNGSPGGTPPGTIAYAMSSQARLMKSLIHSGVRDLIERKLRGE